MGLWNRLMNGFEGFRTGWLNADTQQDVRSGQFNAYIQWEARQDRYDLFWAMFQNNTFDAMSHRFSATLKAQFALYKHTRNIFCPGKRLGDFWGQMTYNGELDPDAGDGETAHSAVPIKGATAITRRALARVWRDSKWQLKKENWARDGAVYGDCVLKVVDDPVRRRVTMKVVHPGHLKWVDRDDAGRVKSYIIEQQRYDPRTVPFRDISPVLDPRDLLRTVTYNEECFVDGNEVVYRTYLNGALFDWRRYSGDGEEAPPEWRVPYSVVPLVLHGHQDIGLDYGMGEVHCLISKVFEVDDLASGMGDQIRKIIRAPWIVWGVDKKSFVPVPWKPSNDPDHPSYGRGRPSQADREDLNVITTPNEQGRAQSLVADLPLEHTGLHVDRINAEIERDYPELQMDIWASGDTSGRALREARKRVVTKVQSRRSGYDMALADAQKIALYVQSVRGYEGAVAGVDHPDDPRIGHEIGCRPVFEADPLDDIETDQMEATAVSAWVTAGVPLEIVLKRQGWSEEDLAELTAAVQKKRAADMEMMAADPKNQQSKGDAA